MDGDALQRVATARKRVLSDPQYQPVPHAAVPLSQSVADASAEVKRPRTLAPGMEADGSLASQVASIPLSTPPASSSHGSSSGLPTAALLYYFAVSAHQSAHLHLQQVFVPFRVRIDSALGDTIPLYSAAVPAVVFQHDHLAADKALALLVMALDYLKIGLLSRNLSDKERVAFAVEFGQVGIKVLRALDRLGPRRSSKGKEKSLADRVDAKGLMTDLHEHVPSALNLASSQTYLIYYRKKLEICHIELMFLEGKAKTASRLAQQALETSHNDLTQRWRIISLLLEHGDSADNGAGMLQQMNELDNISRQLQSSQLQQLAQLARIRLLFRLRYWDQLQASLDSLSNSVNGLSEPDELKIPTAVDPAWKSYISAHYLLLQALFDGRRGLDSSAKAVLGKAYQVMDDAEDNEYFQTLRTSGGVIKVALPTDDEPNRTLEIQLTTPNVLYQLTYLVTMVSRPEFAGTRDSCRSLSHASAARQNADTAKANDLWDTGFHILHDVRAATDQKRQVVRIQLEIMLEEVTVLLFRSDFDGAEPLLLHIIGESRRHDLFPQLFLHICLLFAIRNHLLGFTQEASQFYSVCKRSIQEGSEMELIFEIGLASCDGSMVGFEQTPTKRVALHGLATRCQLSNNAALQAAGFFLDSLTNEERTVAKKNLHRAYDICSKSGNLLLKCLMFAFTTSVHLFGRVDQTLKQLETGRDIAKSMGGKDRPDGVGQAPLGQFFAVRLKTHHRREQHEKELAQAKEDILKHQARLHELRKRKWKTDSSPIKPREE